MTPRTLLQRITRNTRITRIAGKARIACITRSVRSAPTAPTSYVVRGGRERHRLAVAAFLTSIVFGLGGQPQAYAETDPSRAARDAQKAVQRTMQEAAREEKKQAQRVAAEEKKREKRAAAEAKKQQQHAERQARQLAQREAAAARQQQARAESEARREAAKEAFVRSCAPFEAWIRAGEVPYFQGHRASPTAILAMLRMKRFEPHFGTRYEALTSNVLSELSALASRCLRADGPLAGMTVQERTLILQALSASQHGIHKQLLARSEAADIMLATLGEEALRLTPTKADAERWLNLARQAEATISEAEPAVRDTFFSNMKKADTVAVLPVLSAAVDEALSRSQGLEGMKNLAALAQNPMNPPGRIAMELLSPAGRAARSHESMRIRERIASIALEVAAAERDRIEALGKGLVALEQGKAWQADYQSRLASLEGHSRELKALPTHFREKREAALSDGQADFQQLVLRSPDHESLRRLESQYLMADDARSASGTAMMAALAQRRHDIDKQLALGRPAMPGAAATPSARAITSDTAEGEPDEEVMYDLIHSVLVEATQKQNELMQQCSGGVRSNDMMMNQACAVFVLYKGLTTGLTSNAPVPKILEFEKLGCAPALGKAGYQCDYTLAVEKQLHPAIVGPEAKALLEGSSLKSARFYKTRKGWVIFYTEDAVQ